MIKETAVEIQMHSQFIPAIISIILSFLLAIFHYEVMGFMTTKVAELKQVRQTKLLLTMLIISFSHLLSAFAYSLVYYTMDNHWGMGSLMGQDVFTFYDYFYYSLTVYTSLGFGDIYPTGGLRILSGLETMNGLMMITWSASYTYIIMTRFISHKQYEHSDHEQNHTSHEHGHH